MTLPRNAARFAARRHQTRFAPARHSARFGGPGGAFTAAANLRLINATDERIINAAGDTRSIT